MKISDMILSAVIKKGILYEARNVDVDIDIPTEGKDGPQKITVNVKAEHMTIRIEKD